MKEYIYGQNNQEKVFKIPDSVRKASEKNKKILVLDMDETLVYTRSSTKPLHQNYAAIPVTFLILFSTMEKICMLNTDHTCKVFLKL